MSNAIFENEVIERGTIVNKFVTDKATLLTLAVRTPKAVNFPKFVFFGDLAKDVAENYNEKDHVDVTGNVQSSKRTVDGRTIYSQSIFAEKIAPSPKLLEDSFGKDIGNRYADPINSVKIAGEVVSIFSPSNNIVQITIRTEKNGHLSFVKAFLFSRNSGKVLEDFHKGDTVYMVGEIQTPRKEKDGVTNYFENVVVKEIQKA